jgi:hypothetical protein
MSSRPGSVVAVLTIFGLLAALSACSSSSSTTSTAPPVPLILTIQPAPETSLEVGKTVSFTATPQNGSSTITETVSYQSSNAAVVTIAATGLACAGSWDSLTAPQVCTPGPVGTAQITATVDGVSSPPTTVYVHQHVDKITITPVPTATVPVQTCYSKGQTFTYQATAFSRGVDVTSTVGPFAWQAVNTSVVTLNPTTPTSPVAGLLPGQAQATANIPGLTPIFASASGVTSVPFDFFITCPVQSITLEVNAAVPTAPITIAQGGSQSITVMVVDTRVTTITDVPLTWCSSQPALVTIGTNCATNTANSVLATGTLAGGASITASCTPPNCNTGIFPSLPIYPESSAAIVVTPTGSSTATTSAQAWVTSTDCGLIDGCVSQLVSVTPANGTTAAAASNPLDLPATPNSLVFNSAGTKAYLGTDRGNLGTKGLMVFDPTANPATVTQFTSVAGKVLAVSPDGNKVILSDTVETPNQVFVFDTTANNSVAFSISGATAAAFSPDSLKAFIVAGSTLYVYSKLDALQTILLNAPATDVAFLANSMFGYLAGGDPAGIAFHATCDDPTSPVIGHVNVPGATVIQPLPDGKTMLTLSPPNIQTFTATIGGAPTTFVNGCPAPRGFLTVTNAPGLAVNLGQGNFVPKQLIISPDGGTAYLLASNRSSILVFNIVNRTTFPLALTGNAAPVQASLGPDGSKLFVAASDGTVHIVDTVVAADVGQISFPQNLAALQGGLCRNVNFVCNPELIAVRP